MLVLVTGGGGFLGGAILRQLRAEGLELRSLARGAYPELEAQGVQCLRGSLLEPGPLAEAVEGCTAVIHTAAKAGVWGAWSDFEATNLEGTRRLLAAAQAAGVRSFVHTSSPSVVFDGHDHLEADESLPYPKRFLAPYPATKAQAEAAVLSANRPGFATVALRPHLIWGPGDPHLLPRLAKAARAGRLPVVGSGRQVVDATYVDNAAWAHVLAWRALQGPEPACAGKAYFIAQGEPRPTFALIDELLAAAGAPPVQGRVPAGLAYAAGALLEQLHGLFPAWGEPRMTRFVAAELATSHAFKLEAARRDLGYLPAVSHAEGLARLRAAVAEGSYRP